MAKKARTAGQGRPPGEEEPGVTEQLKEAIRNSGESLNQLGERTGVDSAQLSRFMRGVRDLTLSTADKLCRALGLRLAGGDGGSEVDPRSKAKRKKAKE